MTKTNTICFVIQVCLLIAFIVINIDTTIMYKQIKQTEKELGIAYNSAVEMKQMADVEFEKLDCIYKIAEKYNISPKVILAVMKVESGFDTYAASSDSYGLMQVNEIHLASYGLQVNDVYDVETNAEVGTSILSSCIADSDNLHEALGKYNRGINGYRKYVKATGNTTTEYSKKVIENIRKEKKNEHQVQRKV